MEKSNLYLIDGPKLVYCNFDIKEVAKKSKKSTPIECQYSMEISIDSDKNEVTVALSVNSESKNIPFNFDLKAKAKFKCEDTCPSDQQAIIEAIPYIFPFLKEMVADLTRKAYYSPFYLPSIELKFGNFKEKISSDPPE